MSTQETLHIPSSARKHASATAREDIHIGNGATENEPAVDPERFWDIRAANYDRLFWTKDASYLDEIIRMGALKPGHKVLDVGTGTGTVAKEIRKYVNHVVAVDISDAMLSHGNWTGISALKWDIGNSFFAEGVFDRVFARMVFHHIIDNLDRALLRCYDLLNATGRIVVAEGIPPSENPAVVDWFTEMFRHKEDRLTFTETGLRQSLLRNGFRDVRTRIHVMHNFSVRNWLVNSGLPQEKQELIVAMHRDAPPEVKRAYRMRLVEDDCLLTTKNAILVGIK
jgi:ubiquinone/menaquinone biosynthesis C-methylase UbiE